jgi:hypothetical protein
MQKYTLISSPQNGDAYDSRASDPANRVEERSGKRRSAASQYPSRQSDLRGESKTKRGKDGSKTGKKVKKNIQGSHGAQVQPPTQAENGSKAK